MLQDAAAMDPNLSGVKIIAMSITIREMSRVIRRRETIFMKVEENED